MQANTCIYIYVKRSLINNLFFLSAFSYVLNFNCMLLLTWSKSELMIAYFTVSISEYKIIVDENTLYA